MATAYMEIQYVIAVLTGVMAVCASLIAWSVSRICHQIDNIQHSFEQHQREAAHRDERIAVLETAVKLRASDRLSSIDRQ